MRYSGFLLLTFWLPLAGEVNLFLWALTWLGIAVTAVATVGWGLSGSLRRTKAEPWTLMQAACMTEGAVALVVALVVAVATLLPD
jgi:hypothetical protein